jgi:hypothetical protein
MRMGREAERASRGATASDEGPHSIPLTLGAASRPVNSISGTRPYPARPNLERAASGEGELHSRPSQREGGNRCSVLGDAAARAEQDNAFRLPADFDVDQAPTINTFADSGRAIELGSANVTAKAPGLCSLVADQSRKLTGDSRSAASPDKPGVTFLSTGIGGQWNACRQTSSPSLQDRGGRLRWRRRGARVRHTAAGIVATATQSVAAARSGVRRAAFTAS